MLYSELGAANAWQLPAMLSAAKSIVLPHAAAATGREADGEPEWAAVVATRALVASLTSRSNSSHNSTQSRSVQILRACLR